MEISSLIGIVDEKEYTESVLFEKSSNFSKKTTVHIHRFFKKFCFNEIFGRSVAMELLGLKSSGASKLFSNLLKEGII